MTRNVKFNVVTAPSQRFREPGRPENAAVDFMNACADKTNEAPAGNEQKTASTGQKPERRGDDLPVIESSRLFGGTNEICIEHAGALYRLRITRQGKLILNK